MLIQEFACHYFLLEARVIESIRIPEGACSSSIDESEFTSWVYGGKDYNSTVVLIAPVVITPDNGLANTHEGTIECTCAAFQLRKSSEFLHILRKGLATWKYNCVGYEYFVDSLNNFVDDDVHCRRTDAVNRRQLSFGYPMPKPVQGDGNSFLRRNGLA